ARSRDARGAGPCQAPAPHGAGEGPQDRQREGKPARLFRGRLRGLPQAVRSGVELGSGERGRREARGLDLPPDRRAHDGRARARRRRGGRRTTSRGAALVLAVLLPVVASAAEPLKLPPVTRLTLDNGLRVIVAENHEVPLVEFYVMVGAGAAQDPPGKEGLASLTADALTRGAGTLSAPAFPLPLDSPGGDRPTPTRP